MAGTVEIDAVQLEYLYSISEDSNIYEICSSYRRTHALQLGFQVMLQYGQAREATVLDQFKEPILYEKIEKLLREQAIDHIDTAGLVVVHLCPPNNLETIVDPETGVVKRRLKKLNLSTGQDRATSALLKAKQKRIQNKKSLKELVSLTLSAKDVEEYDGDASYEDSEDDSAELDENDEGTEEPIETGNLEPITLSPVHHCKVRFVEDKDHRRTYYAVQNPVSGQKDSLTILPNTFVIVFAHPTAAGKVTSKLQRIAENIEQIIGSIGREEQRDVANTNSTHVFTSSVKIESLVSNNGPINPIQQNPFNPPGQGVELPMGLQNAAAAGAGFTIRASADKQYDELMKTIDDRNNVLLKTLSQDETAKRLRSQREPRWNSQLGRLSKTDPLLPFNPTLCLPPNVNKDSGNYTIPSPPNYQLTIGLITQYISSVMGVPRETLIHDGASRFSTNLTIEEDKANAAIAELQKSLSEVVSRVWLEMNATKYTAEMSSELAEFTRKNMIEDDETNVHNAIVAVQEKIREQRAIRDILSEVGALLKVDNRLKILNDRLRQLEIVEASNIQKRRMALHGSYASAPDMGRERAAILAHNQLVFMEKLKVDLKVKTVFVKNHRLSRERIDFLRTAGAITRQETRRLAAISCGINPDSIATDAQLLDDAKFQAKLDKILGRNEEKKLAESKPEKRSSPDSEVKDSDSKRTKVDSDTGQSSED